MVKAADWLPIGSDVRVLVDEACAVVDLVVDNNVEVLLAGVLRDVRVSEFLGFRHCAVWWNLSRLYEEVC